MQSNKFLNRIPVSSFCFLWLLLLCAGISCRKNPAEEEGEESSSSHLSLFEVRVTERVTERAIIAWDSCVSDIAGDTVYYKVALNGKTADSNRTYLADTLLNLQGDATYTGQVTAYTKNGHSRSASFELNRYIGFVYVYEGGQLVKYGSFPNPSVSIPFWRATYSGPERLKAPIISNDTIFTVSSVNSGGGIKVSFNSTSSGSLLGSFTDNSRYSSPLTYYGGKLYNCGVEGVFACEAGSGSVLWKFSEPGRDFFGAATIVTENGVFVNSTYSDGYIYALNKETGSLAWRFSTEGGSLGKRMLAAGGKLITGTSTGMVYALNQKTGSVVWQTKLNGEMAGWLQSPIVIGNNVMVYLYNVGWYALDINTGNVRWTFSDRNNPQSGLGSDGTYLYYTVTDRENTNDRYTAALVAINANDGSLLYKSRFGYDYSLTNLIYAKGKLYLRADQNLYVFDAKTATPETNILEHLTATSGYSVVINDTVYYSSENGNARVVF